MAVRPRPRNARSAGPRRGPALPPAARRPDPRVRQNVPAEQVANRVAVATASGIAFLGRLPKGLLPGFVAVGLVVGLITGGVVGLVLLVAVAALMGWLLAAFWPLLPTAGRTVRAAALIAVVVVAVLRFVTA